MRRGETGRYHVRNYEREQVRALRTRSPAAGPSPGPGRGPAGRLDSVTALLPQPALFIYAYVRKEAVLSSQIEGTQSSFSDLVKFESGDAPGAPHRRRRC